MLRHKCLFALMMASALIWFSSHSHAGRDSVDAALPDSVKILKADPTDSVNAENPVVVTEIEPVFPGMDERLMLLGGSVLVLAVLVLLLNAKRRESDRMRGIAGK